ncbi:MAG: hypothetical protein M3P83_06505 [Actinomycetota bacterium]|nr:hypothetical protein [Actinomycetota bacterium]
MTRAPLEPGSPHQHPEDHAGHGRLAFRRRPPVEASGRAGVVRLDRGDGEQLALAYVPAGLGDEPVRLVVLLHGAVAARGRRSTCCYRSPTSTACSWRRRSPASPPGTSSSTATAPTYAGSTGSSRT